VQRALIAAGDVNVPFLASALTFDALLAGVPFVLLLLVGFSFLLQGGSSPVEDLNVLMMRFIPPSAAGSSGDLTGLAHQFLITITGSRGTISVFATALFIWFSTRLFASVRTALNRIYHMAAPKHRDRHFLVRMLLNKSWDVVMVGMLLLLFVINTLLGAALTSAEAWSMARMPGAAESVSYIGRFLNIALGFVFAFLVLTLVYRYASSRPVPWRTAFVASTFAALAIELAKRIFGLYLAAATDVHGIVAYGSFTTVILLVLWAYYSSIVFLLGGVVAETWAERGEIIRTTGTFEVPQS
jgi:membrane protein